MSNGPQKVTDPIFVDPPPEGLLNNAVAFYADAVRVNQLTPALALVFYFSSTSPLTPYTFASVVLTQGFLRTYYVLKQSWAWSQAHPKDPPVLFLVCPIP